MGGFAKLHSGIVDSSIWTEDHATRIVWITFLAKADASGNVIGCQQRLAASANVSIDEYDIAIEKLSSPDPESKTPDEEGRRIVPIQGGWRLVNHAKYRAKRDSETRKEQNREAQKRRRERAKNASAKSAKRQPMSAQAEAEADKERPNSEEFALACHLLEKIKEHKTDFKAPNLNTWAKAIDRMLRLDHRKPERIREVIDWAQGHSFWQTNILSAEKLRKQFDQLEIQMAKPPPGRNPSSQESLPPLYRDADGLTPLERHQREHATATA